ncbi:hypothetical protein REPUB_Repub07fG0079500 [Reevesia pubescens]
MNAYCDRQSMDFNSIVFLFDGHFLRGEQTPSELEMKDSDEIDAFFTKYELQNSMLVAV